MSGESECLNPTAQSRVSKFYPIPNMHNSGNLQPCFLLVFFQSVPVFPKLPLPPTFQGPPQSDTHQASGSQSGGEQLIYKLTRRAVSLQNSHSISLWNRVKLNVTPQLLLFQVLVGVEGGGPGLKRLSTTALGLKTDPQVMTLVAHAGPNLHVKVLSVSVTQDCVQIVLYYE